MPTVATRFFACHKPSTASVSAICIAAVLVAGISSYQTKTPIEPSTTIALVSAATDVTQWQSTGSTMAVDNAPQVATQTVSSIFATQASNNVNRASLLGNAWHAARLDELSQTMARNILTGVQQQPDLNRLPDQQRINLLLHYQRQATPDRFATRLRQHLLAAPNQDLLALIALTKSPIARRALKEELAFRPATQSVMQQHQAQILQTPEGLQRLTAIERLDQAIGVTKIAVTVASASLYGTTMALRESLGSYGSDDPKDLDQSIRDFAEQVRESQRQQIHLTYMYLYRNLSLKELLDYVQLQETEPVRSMQRHLVQALGAEMIAIQGDVIRAVLKDAGQATTREI